MGGKSRRREYPIAPRYDAFIICSKLDGAEQIVPRRRLTPCHYFRSVPPRFHCIPNGAPRRYCGDVNLPPGEYYPPADFDVGRGVDCPGDAGIGLRAIRPGGTGRCAGGGQAYAYLYSYANTAHRLRLAGTRTEPECWGPLPTMSDFQKKYSKYGLSGVMEDYEKAQERDGASGPPATTRHRFRHLIRWKSGYS